MAEFRLGRVAAAAGYRLSGFDSVGSTNSAAMAAAGAGDAGNHWFAALQQTEGRGRRNRPWASPSGNLAASLLVLPGADPARSALLGFVAGVALEMALSRVLRDSATERSAAVRIALKWPNDVLADGAKLAGILLEAQKLGDGRTAIVVGCGVNVVAAPEGLPYPAASLKGLGVEVDAEVVFAALSDAWAEIYRLWDHGHGAGDVLRLWRGAAAGLGAPVAIDQNGGIVRGIFETIDEEGRLVVRADDGTRTTITAGDVHFGATASLAR